MRILLAEDNPINQRVVLRMLDRLGCQADIASDGKSAVASALDGNYDVILMDMIMPEMSGLEATRCIRENESDDHKAYIIALTANAMNGDKKRCLGSGMDDYLSKPFLLDQLRRKLASCPCMRDSRSDLPTIDPRVIHAFCESMGADDHAFLNELFSDFLTDAARVRTELHEGLQEENASRVRIAAHSLKASSGLFGAGRLTFVCDEIESLAISLRLGEVRLAMSRFEGALNDVRSELEEFVDRRSIELPLA